MACAWGGFAGYGVAMLLSFFIGRHYYPIRYDLKIMGWFAVLTAIFYVLYETVLSKCSTIVALLGGTVLLLIFIYLIYKEIKK